MTEHPRLPTTALLDLPLPDDDTEESITGADWHQDAIELAHIPLKGYADERAAAGLPPWYVSSQVTVLIEVPGRVWAPKPNLFVVPGAPAHGRTSYDTRTEGPVPPFILEVASGSTWHSDVGLDKRNNKLAWYGIVGVREYLVFDPTRSYLRAPMRGWRATPSGWQPWPPGRRSDGTEVWTSEVLGLGVYADGPRVIFEHPQRGPLPLDPEARREIARLNLELGGHAGQLAELNSQLAEERRRREELEAELRRLRGDV